MSKVLIEYLNLPFSEVEKNLLENELKNYKR